MATASQKQVGRTANGQFRPGVSGNAAGNVHRSRHALNADTIRAMHKAFREGGEQVIRKVMKNQPAVFLKLLVLLVPREFQVEHKGGVKAMTDEQLEAAFELLQGMVDQRLGEKAKVVEGTAETAALPSPAVAPDRPNKVTDAADTAVGATRREPGKARVPSPAGT
jgi:hypothetical protein